MKKYILLLMCLLTSLGSWAQYSGSGSGTSSDPYLIFNPTQLAQMVNFLNQSGVVFELKSNIDLTEFIAENYSSTGWAPIGVSGSPFKGTLKGNGKTITGLSVNRGSTSYVGLFGNMEGATVTNLTIEASNIVGAQYTGLLAGYAKNCSISNVTANCTNQVKGSAYVGGLVGYASGSITGSSLTGKVTGTGNSVGGIVGKNSATLSNCKYNGNVNGAGKVGGICGETDIASSFTSCQSKASVSSSADYAGGILGYGDFVSIIGCSQFGDVSGTNNVGGIYGGNKLNQEDFPIYKSDFGTDFINNYQINKKEELERSISKCTAIGNITGQNQVGGLAGTNYMSVTFALSSSKGWNFTSASQTNYKVSGGDLYRNGVCIWDGLAHAYTGVILWYFNPWDDMRITIISLSDCYYNGDVTGKQNVGGLVGKNIQCNLSQCYSCANVVGETNVGGLIGDIADVSINYNGSSKTLPPRASIYGNVAINNLIKASQSGVGRIYGSKSNNRVDIGDLGATEGNISINKTNVVKGNDTQIISEDLQNGTSIGMSMLKLKASYVAKGWDFDNVWAIQETESFPYMCYQTVPPVFEGKLKSRATSVTVKSINGGTVYLYYNNETVPLSKSCTADNTCTFTTSELQSGTEARIYAEKSGLAPSYFTTATVELPELAGSGTQTDPYRIYSAEDLRGTNKNGYYKVMNDIDLASWISANSSVKGWVNMGCSNTDAIYIDGDGHTIKNLWTNTSDNYSGLFSRINSGYIKNLSVLVASNRKVKGGQYTGILCGSAGVASLENIIVKGNVEGTEYVGGVAGMGDGVFSFVNYEGTVSSASSGAYVGGIAGYMTGAISKSKAKIDITASGSSSQVGGIAGRCCAISESCAMGNIAVTGNYSDVGGLVGYSIGTVQDCYSLASVNGKQCVGGLVGYSTSLIARCYAAGDVTGKINGGGIVAQLDGTSAKVQNSVAASNQLTFTDQSSWACRVIGGYKNGAADPDNSNYALKTMQVTLNGVPTKKYDDLVEGIGKEQSVLYTSAFYEGLGWDMANVWSFNEGSGYPYFDWAVEPITGISLNYTYIIVSEGETLPLKATVLPTEATNKCVIWSSSNPEVAFVSDSGLVIAVSNGKTTITATAADGSGVTATATVVVGPSVNIEGKSVESYITKAATIQPFTWYILTQKRNGETPAYDSGLGEDIKRAAAGFNIPKGAKAEEYSNYLIRLLPTENEGVFRMQWGNGNFWGTALKSVASIEDAGLYKVYNINGEDTHFGINVTTNGTILGQPVDNNGAGSTVVFWGSGQVTTLNGNNDWCFYPVELSTYDSEQLARNEQMANLIIQVEQTMAKNNLNQIGDNLITEAKQLSSDFSDSSEGVNMDALIDESPTTFWHTNWHSTPAANIHPTLNIELAEPISGDIQLTFQRRNVVHDHAVAMQILCSTDGTDYIEADQVSLPFTAQGEVVRAVFNLPTPVKYLSIYSLSNVNNNGEAEDMATRNYWHAAEIQLNKISGKSLNEEHPEEAASLSEALNAAKGVGNTTQDDIDALRIAYDAYLSVIGHSYTITLTNAPDNAAITVAGNTYSNGETIVCDRELSAEDVEPQSAGYVLEVRIEGDEIIASFHKTGDANGDSHVNVQDYIGVAKYILTGAFGGFDFLSADVNIDKTINVRDYIGIAKIILGGSLGAPARRIRSAESNVSQDKISASYADGTLSIDLDNVSAYTAFQLDVTLPEGVTLLGVDGSNRMSSSHIIEYAPQDGNTWRILVGCPKLSTFLGNSGNLLRLHLSDGKGECTINDALFVTPDDDARLMDSVKINISTSGIDRTISTDDTPERYNLQGLRINAKTPQRGVILESRNKVIYK